MEVKQFLNSLVSLFIHFSKWNYHKEAASAFLCVVKSPPTPFPSPPPEQGTVAVQCGSLQCGSVWFSFPFFAPTCLGAFLLFYSL